MLEQINAILWGPGTLILMCAAGLFFMVKTRGKPVNFPKIFKQTFGNMFKKHKKNEISPFSAMSAALASCLGTGNIAGVAAAIAMGGAGALFWMWVAAFLSTATKYYEVYLSVQYRVKRENIWRGGPMYYIERALGLKRAAVAFAAVMMIATLGTGNLTQVGAMTDAAVAAFGVPPIAVGITALMLTAFAVLGGTRIVAKTAEKLVPFAGIVYISGAIVLIAINHKNLIPAFADIFNGAFGLKAAAGGAAGFTAARAMRFGLARGIFSNEAGMGTSPIAHAAADSAKPETQAAWGAMEVCLDTLVMCSLTGLALLTSGAADMGAAFGAVFGNGGERFVAVSLSLFALASVMGWSCYGEACAVYLGFPTRVYKLLYLAGVPLGSVLGMGVIWQISDTLNALILLPNVVAIVTIGAMRKEKNFLRRK